MDKNISLIKERILQIAEKQGDSKKDFFKKIGMTPGNFRGSQVRTAINSDALAIILSQFPDIDPRWLITGEGTMIHQPVEVQQSNVNVISKRKTDRNVNSQEIPLYHTSATAGVVEIISNPTDQSPVGFITIPGVPKCDGALPITGDSMYPLLKSGDIALYKKVNDYQNIMWGEMYLIALEHNGDRFFFAKYVQQSDKKGFIKLVSENRHHQEKEFPQECIMALARILATVRINTNSF
jgi:phage repressor protein C with HTH and peptisase S24 domain